VFGVAVPGADGRAGMAALVASDLDLAAFRRYLVARLPDYARPVFLRLISNIELTGTFKLRKQEPVAEGYDCTRITDPVYFDDRQAYTRLDAELYARLQQGKMRI
jgi:fatty-acyl-CoA synthase